MRLRLGKSNLCDSLFRMIPLVLAFVFLLTSCQNGSPTENEITTNPEGEIQSPLPEQAEKQLTVGNEKFTVYGEDVLYASDCGLISYHQATGDVSRLCKEQNCSGCLLDTSTIRFAGLEQDRLYFSSVDTETERRIYAVLNLSTKDTVILYSVDQRLEHISETPFLYEGSLFFTSKKIDNGSSGASVFCLLSTGECKTVYTLAEKERFVGVYENYLITWCEHDVYAISIDAGTKVVLRDQSSLNGSYELCGKILLYNKYLYYQYEVPYTLIVSEYTNCQYPMLAVERIDLKDALSSALNFSTDQYDYENFGTGTNYCPFDEKVYILDSFISYLNVPENYLQHPETVIESVNCAMVYNPEIIKTTKHNKKIIGNSVCEYQDLELIGNYLVFDGALYSEMRYYDADTAQWGEAFWGKIVFSTNEVVEILRRTDYDET